MSTPTARYIITADDRSKAAIASVRKGFQDMERGVKASIKGVNTVLGIFVGVQLKQGFQQILRATEASAAGTRGFAQALNEVRTAAKDLLAAKSGLPEATKSMQELRDILKDPGLVAAADAFTSALITGFAKASTGIATTVKGMRSAAVSAGLVGPTTRKDLIDVTKGQIASKESDLVRLRATALSAGIDEGSSPDIAAARAELADLNAKLRIMQTVVTPRGPATRGGARGLGPMGGAPDLPLPGRRGGGGGGDFRSGGPLPGRLRDFNSVVPIAPETLERSGKMFTDTFGDIEDSIKDSMENVTKAIEGNTSQWSVFAEQAARNMQDSLADFFFDPFKDGLKGLLRGFVDTLRQMAAQAAAASVFESLFGKKDGKGGSVTGVLGSVLGSIFGGARAGGGPVSAGKAYLVGERGPELFTPGMSGGITPNGKMGGGIVINQSIDARGATADMAAALPAILAENNRKMYDELDRRFRLR
jgi:hypothetical protein